MLQIARKRASRSKYIGISFCIIGLLIPISEYVKYAYFTDPAILKLILFPFIQKIKYLYANYAWFRGVWMVAPEPSFDMPVPFFNLAGLTALRSCIVGAWLRDRALGKLRLIAQAEHILTLQQLVGANISSQAIGNIQAGGDVTINQINQAHETANKLTHGFRDGPLWSLVTGIVFPLCVTIIGHLLGLQ